MRTWLQNSRKMSNSYDTRVSEGKIANDEDTHRRVTEKAGLGSQMKAAIEKGRVRLKESWARYTGCFGRSTRPGVPGIQSAYVVFLYVPRGFQIDILGGNTQGPIRVLG